MGRTKQWRDIYEDWKEKHPDIEHEERVQIVRGCQFKFAYPDFLSALYAVRGIELDLGGKNSIYWCQICRMNHVGRHKGKPQFPKKLMRTEDLCR